jgi:WD40 repeat protein
MSLHLFAAAAIIIIILLIFHTGCVLKTPSPRIRQDSWSNMFCSDTDGDRSYTTFTGHESGVRYATFSFEGDEVMSCSSDGCVKVCFFIACLNKCSLQFCILIDCDMFLCNRYKCSIVKFILVHTFPFLLNVYNTKQVSDKSCVCNDL